MLKIAQAQAAKAAPIVEWVIPSTLAVMCLVAIGWVALVH